MSELPANARVYRTTAEWDERSVPSALRSEHSTKSDVWGRLVVVEGEVAVRFAVDDRVEVARVGAPVLLPPAATHAVERCEGARFFVEFLRVSEAGS